jgi:hypothetical protein
MPPNAAQVRMMLATGRTRAGQVCRELRQGDPLQDVDDEAGGRGPQLGHGLLQVDVLRGVRKAGTHARL